MPTLADISENDPQDTEAVSQGALRIRALTEAAKTTMDVEHAQTGEHQFPVAQPGTPVTNQIWFDLVNTIIRRYDGTDHRILNAVGMSGTANTSPTTLVQTPSFTTIMSLPLSVPVGSRALILAMANPQLVSGTFPSFVSLRIRRSGVTLSPSAIECIRGDEGAISGAKSMFLFAVDGPFSGSRTYTLEGANTNGVSIQVTDCQMFGLVF